MDTSMATPVRGTDPTHPDGQYGAIAKLFHWTTVVLMAIALPAGFLLSYITEADNNVHKYGAYAIHESAGLTILFVAILRLVWRRLSPPPAPAPHLPATMRRASDFVHHALYAMLIIQPIMGFLATNAFGFPMQGATAYLGFIDLPKFMETHETLAKVFGTIHTIGGYLTAFLLAAHIGAAVFHHAIRRDGTLLRML
ncbi:cytochrome b [Plastoroseomonas arctica]|uniref:Cytochrome b n=1 Tax=Plastoroseomonas arctica TaxID=1509237 RepID=A0AAF1KUI3_9PROT|nr:cytochrome b [Plastoroseomonas arctica]MBR0656217.1 cytochrome b [Plastoroseomonas arctica]